MLERARSELLISLNEGSFFVLKSSVDNKGRASHGKFFVIRIRGEAINPGVHSTFYDCIHVKDDKLVTVSAGVKVYSHKPTKEEELKLIAYLV